MTISKYKQIFSGLASPIQTILQKNIDSRMFVFGPHLLKKAANMQKSYALKKTMPCVFFFKNTKTSRQAFLKKAQCDVFKFVTNYNLLSPLKKTQGIVFSAH